MAIALVWVRVGTLLRPPLLASFARHRLRLATIADLILVVDRMTTLLGRELARRVRAIRRSWSSSLRLLGNSRGSP